MDEIVFEKLRTIIYDESGIVLAPEKKPLLQTRVGKRIRALALANEREYLSTLLADQTGDELVNLLDVVSTNVTYFWREPEHFDFLARLFQTFRAQNKRSVRLWCAASSSGEEPYTISMLAHEYLDPRVTDFRMLATDISLTILRQAMRGAYLPKQFEHLPTPLRDRYLVPGQLNGEERWFVKEELKRPILFKRLNLSDFPFPLHGPFDIIFCRNVMIYFDNGLREKIVHEFERLMPHDGHLVISKTESLLNVRSDLIGIGNSIYRKGESQ